jgi:hypothetical protein
MQVTAFKRQQEQRFMVQYISQFTPHESRRHAVAVGSTNNQPATLVRDLGVHFDAELSSFSSKYFCSVYREICKRICFGRKFLTFFVTAYLLKVGLKQFNDSHSIR